MGPPKRLDDDCGSCLLFGALQAIPDGVVLVDTSDRVLHANAVAFRLLGLDDGSRIGEPLRDLLDHPGLSAFWSAASSEPGTTSGEVGLVTGETLRVSVAPCRTAGGELMGRLLLLRDISREKRIQVSLAEDVARRLIGRELPGSEPPEVAGLTRRERQILALMAGGLTNARIADQLHVSVNTVASHVKNLYSKIRVRSRSEATAFAVRHGLTRP